MEIRNLAEADEALKVIGGADQAIVALTAALKDQTKGLKTEFEAKIAPRAAEIQELEQALSDFAYKNKKELFLKTKTIDLANGKIGFRTSSKMELREGQTWQTVLEYFKAHKKKDCIRIKEEVNKERLSGLMYEELEEAGVYKKTADAFWYEC